MPQPTRRSPIIAALLVGLAALVASLAGCDDEGSPPAAWLLDPALPMPSWLSEAGIYADLPGLLPSGHFVAFEPPHPLFSNRAAKARLLWLPPDSRIDTANPEGWVFPVGTVLVKTFTYRHAEGRVGDVAVETRIIRRVTDGWQYGVYHWGTAGRDARLIDDRWPEERFVLADVSGSDFTYVIPGELDCEACHETHTGAPIIGLGPGNFDPALVRDLPELFSERPTAIPLPARNPAEAEAMSYVVGNCVHCHHGMRGDDNAAFDLRPSVLVAHTVGVPTDSSASGDGIRVVPGHPAGSALYEAVVDARSPDYGGDFKPMPPVGVVDTDHDAARILGRWIAGLESE